MFPLSDRKSNPYPIPHLVLAIALCFFPGCALLPRLAYGQATQNEPSELDTAIVNVKLGNVGPRDVVVIVNAGAVKAIPALEEQFRRTTNVVTKDSIASGLVRLGDHDNTYWNFLLEQATIAVNSNIPDGNFSESQGRMMNRPPELQAWADAHNVSVKIAGVSARYDMPGKVLQLATSGDQRGIPLLQRALKSHNFLMVAWAAKGLAQVQDKHSIPLIIAAVQRAPAGYDAVIAEPLLYFEEAQAQNAFDTHVSKKMAALDREAKAGGRGVFGW